MAMAARIVSNKFCRNFRRTEGEIMADSLCMYRRQGIGDLKIKTIFHTANRPEDRVRDR